MRALKHLAMPSVVFAFAALWVFFSANSDRSEYPVATRLAMVADLLVILAMAGVAFDEWCRYRAGEDDL